jgi:hypothetical protein
MIWLALQAARPWHLMLAGFVAWSGFVGVRAYRAGGEAAAKKIERIADANVEKAEKARAAVRPIAKPDSVCLLDPHCRR